MLGRRRRPISRVIRVVGHVIRENPSTPGRTRRSFEAKETEEIEMRGADPARNARVRGIQPLLERGRGCAVRKIASRGVREQGRNGLSYRHLRRRTRITPDLPLTETSRPSIYSSLLPLRDTEKAKLLLDVRRRANTCITY